MILICPLGLQILKSTLLPSLCYIWGLGSLIGSSSAGRIKAGQECLHQPLAADR